MTSKRIIYCALRTHVFPYFFWTVILLSSISTKAQIELFHFNGFSFYTEINGLPSTYITDIREDKHGFLWIGTANGISRYDGNQFTNFTQYSEYSGKHKFGFINSLIMDKSGEFLFVACDNGIYTTSIDTVNFQNIEEKFPQINNSPERVTDLFLDKENKLWAASNKNGLHFYDLENRQHEQFLFKDTINNTNAKLNSLQCIVNDPQDKNTLWIGSLAGLIQFNSKSKDYKIHVYNSAPEVAQNSIRRIHTTENEVYLGTWKKGLVIFDKESKQFRQPLMQKFPNSHLLIFEIYHEPGNKLWITSSDGLIKYDTKAKEITKVIEHNTDKGLVRGVSYYDSRGLIWFGFGKGLFKYDPIDKPVKFIELEKRNKIQNPLLVREIIRSNDFIYVAGQYSSGLYKINLVDGSVEVIKIPLFDYHEKVGYNLMDMVDMRDGHFLLISGKKVALFNQKTKKVSSSPLQINHPNPSLQSVVKDRNNQYWIGTRAGGLYLLNFTKNKIHQQAPYLLTKDYQWLNHILV